MKDLLVWPIPIYYILMLNIQFPILIAFELP